MLGKPEQFLLNYYKIFVFISDILLKNIFKDYSDNVDL